MHSHDGLIFAYILDGDGGGTAVDWESIIDWGSKKGPLWVHLYFSKSAISVSRMGKRISSIICGSPLPSITPVRKRFESFVRMLKKWG